MKDLREEVETKGCIVGKIVKSQMKWTGHMVRIKYFPNCMGIVYMLKYSGTGINIKLRVTKKNVGQIV